MEPLGNDEIPWIEVEYYDNETAYLNLLYAYHSLIDNGNTNALLNQIQQAWSTEAQVLRDELMELSPYLSEDILREVAVMNVLPPAMLLTVCLANPDATRSEGFIRFLETEIPEPLPAYMLHLIMASWEDATGRTGMENMLADYNARMAVLSDKLLKDLYLKSELDPDSLSLSDTTGYKTKIVYWLNRTQTLSAKYSLAEHYISEQNYEDAETVIESIPSDFRMDDLQIQAYNDYIEYVNLRKWLDDGGIEISELDTASMEMLTAFAFANENFARSMAANALCFYYDLCREEDYFLPSGSRLNILGHAPESLSFESTTFIEPVITAWPIPAADFVTFTYQLPTLDKYSLLITDITGKEIARFILTELSGKIIWETNRVNNGLYFYQIKGIEGGNKSRGKITVRK